MFTFLLQYSEVCFNCDADDCFLPPRAVASFLNWRPESSIVDAVLSATATRFGIGLVAFYGF